MATGQVSSTNITPWQLVSTVTTTTGTTATFSSLAGYKQYMLCWNGVTTGTASGTILLNFNGTSTNYSSVINYGSGATKNTTGIGLTTTYTSTDGYVNIYDVLSSGPKEVAGISAENYYPGHLKGVWNNTAAITSMVITSNGGAYTAGTWTLYGIAA